MAIDRFSYLLSLRRKISADTHLGSWYIVGAICVSAEILAVMVKCPDGIKPDDWAEVRTAVGLFVRQLRGTDLHYHNIIGNNKDALMHVFGMGPMTFGAMMITAGVVKFRKARGGGDDDKILSINKGHWESIMADAKIDDTGRITTYGSDRTIVVSIGTMNPVKAERANKSRFRWNDIMTVEQQFSSTPPIPPPRRNSFKLRVKFQQAVAPHIMGGYDLLQWESNREILEQGEKFARAIGSDEARYNDDANDANDNANLSKWYFDIEDEETKKALQDLNNLHKRALKLVRKLEMSVTPKWTLEEDHVEDHHKWLIENEWGGEAWLDESYVEHEHQTGVKEDRRTHAMKSFRDKHSAQMKNQHRSSNRAVQGESVERKRKINQRPGAQNSAKRQIKEEYRKKMSTDVASDEEDGT